jgi:hypothetical protein
MWVLSLLACASTSEKGSEVEPSGTESGTDTAPLCELTEPWPADTVDDVSATSVLWLLNIVEPAVLQEDATDTSDWTGCPSVAVDGDTTTLSGDCEAEGVTFDGTWTNTATDIVATEAFDGVRYTDEGWGVAFTADGAFRVSRDGDTMRVAAADYRITTAGTGTGHGDGTFEWEDFSETDAADATAASGRVFTDSALGRGDFCLAFETTTSPECPDTWSGTLRFDGTSTWIFSPEDDPCSPCSEVTRDGASLGTVCPD